MSKSFHQTLVETFMKAAGQDLPAQPIEDPGFDVRKLRATLILEEALETIAALGFRVNPDFHLAEAFEPNVVDMVDGCCDIKVVTTGTLSAYGISDLKPQEMIDFSNLQKFGPGGHRREDGKWVKPSDWKAPDLLAELERQGLDTGNPIIAEEKSS